ncbi:uncharacterized protein EV154DRAFT_512192 [Mucor mucedo]|uniref:uncharacterized protein n=1 Tax=Mucor mucedo TaxID=29922 RepID=UPI002220EFDF|nr:uncharacterized protein EV154DRAFT_512192 [Mucor mucedo]KAI7890171.1 hypothetical protein EV154DRAFT_512192 [Mucor mucedo]
MDSFLRVILLFVYLRGGAGEINCVYVKTSHRKFGKPVPQILLWFLNSPKHTLWFYISITIIMKSTPISFGTVLLESKYDRPLFNDYYKRPALIR